MIQIDIPMPENCYQCPCLDGEFGECNITAKSVPSWPPSRPEDCPLKEVENEST